MPFTPEAKDANARAFHPRPVKVSPMHSRRSLLALSVALAFPALSAIAQPKESVTPMIVVFQDATPFHQFHRNARADERSAADPHAWGYVDRGVLGAVQRLEGLHR